MEPQGGFEPANLPITNRLRCHCATGAGECVDDRRALLSMLIARSIETEPRTTRSQHRRPSTLGLIVIGALRGLGDGTDRNVVLGGESGAVLVFGGSLGDDA